MRGLGRARALLGRPARGAPPSAPDSARAAEAFDRLVAAADAARDRGDPREAADGYDAALALRHDAPGVWVQLGNMAKDVGDQPRAQAAYACALELQPAAADTHLQLARSHRAAGEAGQARSSYLRALELDADCGPAADELGRLEEPPPWFEASPPPSPPQAAERIVSRIEHVDETGCRGWIVDEAAPDRRLSVVCRLNGATLAAVQAAGVSRELQDRYGGAGRHAFQVRFAPTPEMAGLAEGVLEVVEPDSGHVLLRGHRLRFSSAPLLDAREEARASLVRYRAEIDRLLGALEEQDAGRPVPLRAYDRVADDLRIPAPPPSPGGFDAVVLASGGDGSDPAAAADGLAAQAPRPRAVHVVCLEGPAAYALAGALAARGLNATVHRPTAAGAPAFAEAAQACAAGFVLLTTDRERLQPLAAAWLLHAAGGEGRTAAAYADSDVERADGRLEPRFRTALDPDLLVASDEYDTAVCLPRDVLVGLAADAGDDPDPRLGVLLRHHAREGAPGFRHVPLVLGRRRAAEDDDAEVAARSRTAAAHLARQGARLEPHHDALSGALPGRSVVAWPADRERRLSAVVLTRDGAERVASLADTMAERLGTPDRFEMLVVSNNSRDARTAPALREIAGRHAWLRVVEREGAFSWSQFNTEAAGLATGELLLFLNDDMLCTTDGWDDRLRGQLQRPDVGAVGARLLYPDGTLQHAGVVMKGPSDAAHEGAGDAPAHDLYRHRTQVSHDVAAVTGAFLGVRRDTFERLGGFAADFPLTYNDLEFAGRVWNAGLRVVYDPAQTWVHYESVSRGFDANDAEKSALHDQAVARLAARPGRSGFVDLRYNPHFSRRERPFSTLRRPTAAEAQAWIAAQDRAAGPR